MTRRIRLRSVFLLVLLGASAGSATESAGPDLALELMHLSGMYRQLGSFSQAVEQQMASQPAEIPAATRGALLQALRAFYAPQPLRAAALAHLRQRLDPAQAREVVKWLRSERGRRITGLEESASTPESAAQIQAYAASLQSGPPGPERIERIQRLDRVTRSTDVATEVALKLAAAVARGLTAALAAPPTAADIAAALEAQRPEIRASMQQATLVSLLYTYRSLPDSELDAYIAFLESGAGRWYQGVTTAALMASLDQAGDRFGTGLASSLRPAPPANAR